MNPSEREDLLGRFFEGDLEDDAARRLEELLLADPQAARRFEGLVAVEGLLRAREAPKDGLPERVVESVRDERRRRLTHRVMETLHSRSRWRRARSAAGLWIVAAAGLLVGLSGILYALLRTPLTPPVVVERTVPAPPEPDPLPPPRPPPIVEPPRLPDPAPPPLPTAPPPIKVLPPPPSTPAPVPEAPAPKPPPPVVESRTLALVLEKVEGTVHETGDTSRVPAKVGGLEAGRGLETGAKSAAVVRYPDGTRLELGADSVVAGLFDREKKGRGKRLKLSRGTLGVEAARQPADEPMILSTPHGEVRVLGTSFRVYVDGQTTVEVREGKVRIVRAKDGRGADLSAGHFGILAADLEPAARPANVDEIVLLPAQGRITGDEWKLLGDRRASTGLALEALQTPFKPADHVRKRPSAVTFTFLAAAGREYRVWVRASSQATGDPWTRDLLTVDPYHAGANQKCPFFGTSDQTCFVFGGLAAHAGYHWVSGLPQEGREATPLVVKFAETGPQTLKLYVAHPSIRIDAVWLSSTQTVRPPPRQLPP